ncbi:hypothetical protein IL306_012582 [Fusarium sp. DS 682]|nr:hypothetical protein IL306_012582 [Fusarium sp. DS 682]
MARTKQTARKSTAGRSVRFQLLKKAINKRLTPLHHAAISGRVKILRTLLTKGRANIEKKGHFDQTPLHYAVMNGHLGAVKLLLNHNASVSARNDDSFTPLTFAVTHGQLEIFNILLENGAPESTLCSNGRTLLHYAAKHGHIEIAKILLQRGISLRVQDKNHRTALDFAVYNQQWDLAKLLLKEGRIRWVCTQSQPQDERNSQSVTFDDDAVISTLERGFADVGRNSLEAVACLGREDLIRRFLDEHGCHPEGRSLDIAVENGHQTCVEILVLAGADVNSTSYGCEGPLELALRLQHHDIAGILLSAGALLFLEHEDRSSDNRMINLLSTREPSEAAQLLFYIPSIDTLSVALVKMARFRQINILQEYFRAVVPNIRNKYINQPALQPKAKLVRYLIQTQGTTSNRTRPQTRASTDRSLNAQSAIVAALHTDFIGVFFLVSAVEPEILNKVFASVPIIREKAEQLLPSQLDRLTDKDLLDYLSNIGFTLPPLPKLPPLPPLTLYDVCEAGSTIEAQRRLLHGYEDVNTLGPRNRTPLHTAAQQGYLEIVKLLVNYGADLKAKTFFGSTAEQLAEKFHQPAVAAFLKTSRSRQSATVPEGNTSEEAQAEEI